MSALKNHPFPIEAFFESSLVITYAIPKAELEKYIPESLQLDTHNNEWAFIAIAIVQTKNLRPKGFPQFMGNDFVLAGFRIFVRYANNQGKRLRGLYILKSETNKRRMSLLGNIFTHYNYNTTDLLFSKKPQGIQVKSIKSGLDIEIKRDSVDAKLPITSPFKDWKEARRFAGPLPFTFTYNNLTKEVLIIEGVRQDWDPQPLEVVQSKVNFIDECKFKNCVLANAFLVENVPYYWKKGKVEIWKA
jgi:hypothetical protein